KTLNPFGQAYMQAGRNLAAFAAIAAGDADGDGYSNEAEIQAGRLPGDPDDNPAVTEAPAKTYTRAQLRQLPKTTQFMVMDTAKAGDAYCTYGGVDVWTLLQDAGIRDDAANITVFAADGYSKSYAVEDLKKDYAQGLFYTKFPWLRYPLGTAYRHGDQLPGNLRYLLAYEENGYPLQESKIDAVLEKIIGEGPYRFVTPLAQPVAPDRSAWSIDRDDPPYPYNHDRPVIRNGDYCIKAVVAIRVDTAENRSYQYDWNGRAWEMVQNGELAVYGAINP
ncbi:MAG: hypothetical protein PHU78_05480, partial [Heliobacteriaceae bacterium]|nr:hypothetical protein [Heliobacteriaceae bacterium]